MKKEGTEEQLTGYSNFSEILTAGGQSNSTCLQVVDQSLIPAGISYDPPCTAPSNSWVQNKE